MRLPLVLYASVAVDTPTLSRSLALRYDYLLDMILICYSSVVMRAAVLLIQHYPLIVSHIHPVQRVTGLFIWSG